MSEKKRSTFCILPFVHMQVKPSGAMKPCCRFEFHNKEYLQEAGSAKKYVFDPYNISKGASLSEGQNSELWEDIRQKLLKNEPVAGCTKCYLEESANGFSMRTSENRARNNKNNWVPTYDVSKPTIKYLEMTFGNYCNLKCRTCNADLSSTWWEDENALVETGRHQDRDVYINSHGQKNVNIPFNWKEEDFINLEEIKFTGGEPMVHPDFIKLMDMLIEMDVAKNIKLDIFTNCSWIPGEKYIERLKQFKNIMLSLSIDGVGPVNEYIRNPSKWDIVDKAAIRWLELEAERRDSIHVIWNPTLNIYNVSSIKDMINWWFDRNHSVDEHWMAKTVDINKNAKSNEVLPAGKFKFNVLTYPSYLSMTNLPWDVKEKVICDMLIAISELNYRNKWLCITMLKKLNKTLFDDVHFTKELLSDISDKLNDVYTTIEFPEHWFIEEIRVKFEKVISMIKQEKPNPNDVEKFLSYTEDLDKLREEKFAETFPDLAKAFDDYRKK